MMQVSHLLLIVSGLGYVPKDVSKGIWYDSFGLRRRWIARHRVRFSRSSLSVRQNCAIVTFEHFIDYRPSSVYIQVDLWIE